MMPLLSNTMPELTDTQILHRGIYTVEYYKADLQTVVASTMQSVDAYIDLNGLPNTGAHKAVIIESLGSKGIYSATNNRQIVVRIIAPWYRGD